MPKLVLATASALTICGSASGDPLLELMRTHSKDGPVYAYEMTYKDTEITATGRIDPSQPEGQRVEILTPPKADWTADFVDGVGNMETEADGDIWCVEFAENIPASAAKTRETETSATFSFTPLPDVDADRTERKLMKKINAEVTLDKEDGAILRFNMNLPKAG